MNEQHDGEDEKTKCIKDCIYGHIKMPSLCVAYMDRPEFQRLRRIKQLGNVSRVYPSATHTRFEHCIGVMYLARKMCRALGVTNQRLIHLIQLAGLYHDVGHLPYSHLFDEILEQNKGYHILYPHHEIRSVVIFQRVSNELGLLNNDEIRFVCACIQGDIPHGVRNPLILNNGFEVDRVRDLYLYQIISSDVDVDRLDYLYRDAFHSGMASFQAGYIILNARVHPTTRKLVFRKHAWHEIRNMFRTRLLMHDSVYQHRVSLQYDTLYMYMLKILFEAKIDFGLSDQLCDYRLDSVLLTHELTRDLYQKMELRQELCDIPMSVREKHIPDSGASVEDIVFIE